VRLWRFLRVGVVLVALAATLTACAPGRQPLLAVTLIGGYPVAILRTCEGGPAELTVTENSQPPTATPTASTSATATPATPSPTVTPTTESYLYFWSIRTESAEAINVLPMFTTPTNWTNGGNTLVRLQPDARYIADAKVDGVFDVSPVNFTVDDLHKLKDGEVLYGVNAPLTTVLSRADFEQKAEQSCMDGQPSSSP
jgi:hypothetical protein